MRALVVDDHAVVRAGLRRVLEEHFRDADVEEASSGAEALDRSRRAGFDVVVLDIAMPGQDGLEVLKQLTRERPRQPVLILSMYPEDQYAIRAIRAGAAGYVTKDRAPEELAHAIRRVTAGSKYITATLAERLADDLQRSGGESPHEALSDREYQVMRALATGRSISDIAKTLGLSVKTVSTYRTRLLRKTGLRTNAELIRYAIDRGIVD